MLLFLLFLLLPPLSSGSPLTCDTQEEWRDFITFLPPKSQNTTLTFFDELQHFKSVSFGKFEALLQRAEVMVSSQVPSLLPSPSVLFGYPPCWESAYLWANDLQTRPTSSPSCCLGGVLTSLFVLYFDKSEGGGGGGDDFLNLSLLLLGDRTKYNANFLEGSGWPVSLVDFLSFKNSRRKFEKNKTQTEEVENQISYFLREKYFFDEKVMKNEVFWTQKEEKGPRLPMFLGLFGLQEEIKISIFLSKVAGLEGNPSPSPPSFLVWEVGVHASLSAEALWMLSLAASEKNVLFAHKRLIKKQYPSWVQNVCETFYAAPSDLRKQGLEGPGCDMEEDVLLSEFFEKMLPQAATSNAPMDNIREMVVIFREIVQQKMENSPFRPPDLFVCTIPILCLLFPLNHRRSSVRIPVLGFFGHPPLFMAPKEFAIRKEIAVFMRQKSFILLVSDPFLWLLYSEQLGRAPSIARSQGLYAEGEGGGGEEEVERGEEEEDRLDEAFPLSNSKQKLLRALSSPPLLALSQAPKHLEVLVWDRPFDVLLLGVLSKLCRSLFRGTLDSKRNGGGEVEAFKVSTFPFAFKSRGSLSKSEKRYASLAKMRAAIIFPYDMDLVIFYELYKMGVPLYMPSALGFYMFQQHHPSYDQTFVWGEGGRGGGEGEGEERKRARKEGERRVTPENSVNGVSLLPYDFSESKWSIFDEFRPQTVQFQLLFCDYFRFPFVVKFSSLVDLFPKLLEPFQDLKRRSEGMKRFQEKELERSRRVWAEALERSIGWEE